MEYPCFGTIYAFRGLDGSQLWKLSSRSDIFLLNCEEFDLDGDNKLDCVGTGRAGTVMAFNPRKGECALH